MSSRLHNRPLNVDLSVLPEEQQNHSSTRHVIKCCAFYRNNPTSYADLEKALREVNKREAQKGPDKVSAIRGFISHANKLARKLKMGKHGKTDKGVTGCPETGYHLVCFNGKMRAGKRVWINRTLGLPIFNSSGKNIEPPIVSTRKARPCLKSKEDVVELEMAALSEEDGIYEEVEVVSVEKNVEEEEDVFIGVFVDKPTKIMEQTVEHRSQEQLDEHFNFFDQDFLSPVPIDDCFYPAGNSATEDMLSDISSFFDSGASQQTIPQPAAQQYEQEFIMDTTCTAAVDQTVLDDLDAFLSSLENDTSFLYTPYDSQATQLDYSQMDLQFDFSQMEQDSQFDFSHNVDIALTL